MTQNILACVKIRTMGSSLICA